MDGVLACSGIIRLDHATEVPVLGPFDTNPLTHQRMGADERLGCGHVMVLLWDTVQRARRGLLPAFAAVKSGESVVSGASRVGVEELKLGRLDEVPAYGLGWEGQQLKDGAEVA